MKKTRREMALEKDVLAIAEQLHDIRDFMEAHFNSPISMLPSDFWGEIEDRLDTLQYSTDIAEYFPRGRLYHWDD